MPVQLPASLPLISRVPLRYRCMLQKHGSTLPTPQYYSCNRPAKPANKQQALRSRKADCHNQQNNFPLIMLVSCGCINYSGVKLVMLLSRRSSAHVCHVEELFKPNSDVAAAPQLPYLDLNGP